MNTKEQQYQQSMWASCLLFSERPSLLRTWFRSGKKEDMQYQIQHSLHSRQRAAQRNITYREILNVLDFGTLFQRQGLLFYTIKEKDFPNLLNHKQRPKLKNLIVVIGGKTAQIITCYYAKNAFKHLKKKQKELLKYK